MLEVSSHWLNPHHLPACPKYSEYFYVSACLPTHCKYALYYRLAFPVLFHLKFYHHESLLLQFTNLLCLILLAHCLRPVTLGLLFTENMYHSTFVAAHFNDMEAGHLESFLQMHKTYNTRIHMYHTQGQPLI